MTKIYYQIQNLDGTILADNLDVTATDLGSVAQAVRQVNPNMSHLLHYHVVGEACACGN
jgi:hypothetical protein